MSQYVRGEMRAFIGFVGAMVGSVVMCTVLGFVARVLWWAFLQGWNP